MNTCDDMENENENAREISKKEKSIIVHLPTILPKK